MQKRQKAAGIYVRLSNEDARAGESVSVENQKLMLTTHAEKMGWELREIYVDDGFSGTNQNRPAFKRMMSDVKAGFINVILIKDLSRLGRNYLEVGNLAEVFLPEHDCELISLNEPLDEMMVFRNWFNEQHSKSTSAKVRAAKRISAEHGKYLGAYAPYGYKKDPANRHKLIIDGIVAPVVRSIFEMRAGGMGFRAIACKLNQDGISPPRSYYYQNTGCKNPYLDSGLWSDSSVKAIIANEVYVGNVVQGKFGTVSYKDSKAVRKPKEEWVRVEGRHKPLIDADLWGKAQAIGHRGHKPRRRNDGGRNLFAGLLRCGDCDSIMRALTERGKRKDGSAYKYIFYICGSYARSGKSVCTSHIISENTLVELVCNQIRTHAGVVQLCEKRIACAVLSARSSEAASYRFVHQHELEAHKKQIAKLDLLIENLYEDKVAGIVSDDLFMRQVKKYEQDRIRCLQTTEDLKKRVEDMRDEKDGDALGGLIRQHKSLEVLDYEILLLLIDKIVVGETRNINDRKLRDIQVIYNYTYEPSKMPDGS